ncbi:Glucosamine 6-phosphate synthetase [Halanaeroarchaeum sp. HSR-CO]|uniref:glutamine--fructose-6-phosphate transaminase (isomerizing) n=1 Tax=Halanaeroarchaeum sp. HSR-CO TaxID=2866382 RepID=UPI00217E7D3F|nr:glutamine--fructose-6-phosphate transaminase (isomerizing) [Halanaeroarchaeum sp. HSR-CO]UWG48107.1 Glucosamine 6-phosphate synthetase [Halanaeroarchaeum sp. HSR-CO]
MCGIIGYVGDQESLPIVADGLKNLEYRGYDSAGVALTDAEGMRIYKSKGEIDHLTLPDEDPATIGIGHTRWSTHGKPTDANAHPHTDCSGEIAVVHNGIIDNFDELKDGLDGHTFTSETDTEVVAHLLEEEYDGTDLPAAVNEVVTQLTGSFALGVTATGFDGIVAVRQDSPLVVGYGDDGQFIASDVPAFVEHTQEVTYLENGDVAVLTRDDVTIYRNGDVVEGEHQQVDWEPERAGKAGYEHYMLKEIHEQPTALRQTISGRIDLTDGQVDLDVELPTEYLQSLEEIQIVAAGTSYHAGLYARQLLEEYAEVRVSVEVASEYEFRGGRDPWRTLVIAVTQSGETADTLDAMRTAANAGAKTLAITNTVGSTAAREADDVVYIRAGPEIGVAATKTFAAQVATLAMFTVYLGRERGVLDGTRATALLKSVRSLPGAIQQVLDVDESVAEIAEEYVDGSAFFFIGRAMGAPVSLEGALKLKEISYCHAEGFAAGELKHGTLALVTEKTPVIAIMTAGGKPEETLHNVKEVQSRGAPVIGVSSIDSAEKYLDASLAVPETGILEPLVGNVYLQLFAYYVADLRGRNIDKPRNLAKSVTVK